MSIKLVLAAAIAAATIVAPTVASAQEATFGQFTHVEAEDDFDDSDRSFVYADSTTNDGASSLIWRCMEDGLNVLYHFAAYKGGDSDDEVLVRYRFDELEATEREYWPLLQGHKSAHIPMDEVASFTSVARRSDGVVIEVLDPLDGEVQKDAFLLEGLGQALATLDCAGI
ncbi:hypothetical protein [Novilysobacter spongiicola]|uniref:Sensory transduction regulator n=1 Tax=Lysobacter spongiicola DSM 21749 TaxID=1122188 RepID=A0A1T4NSU9_9GAMM|nr:hypothetical protein [Lysobacter spongiicola]SJZ82205.1 hypothetical protein SAMN02745674_00888 [Lysobacter spongiicola DSM 21749]